MEDVDVSGVRPVANVHVLWVLLGHVPAEDHDAPALGEGAGRVVPDGPGRLAGGIQLLPARLGAVGLREPKEEEAVQPGAWLVRPVVATPEDEHRLLAPASGAAHHAARVAQPPAGPGGAGGQPRLHEPHRAQVQGANVELLLGAVRPPAANHDDCRAQGAGGVAAGGDGPREALGFRDHGGVAWRWGRWMFGLRGEGSAPGRRRVEDWEAVPDALGVFEAPALVACAEERLPEGSRGPVGRPGAAPCLLVQEHQSLPEQGPTERAPEGGAAPGPLVEEAASEAHVQERPPGQVGEHPQDHVVGQDVHQDVGEVEGIHLQRLQVCRPQQLGRSAARHGHGPTPALLVEGPQSPNHAVELRSRAQGVQPHAPARPEGR
mmetsp:Transcript_12838/g.40509  ORF Transcript_12838/g.40509 Transcript_12838/m.40509 type:complete len:377 (-) Transcript_12838:50-1180(-)